MWGDVWRPSEHVIFKNEKKHQVETGKEKEIEFSRGSAILGRKLKVLGVGEDFSSSLLVC